MQSPSPHTINVVGHEPIDIDRGPAFSVFASLFFVLGYFIRGLFPSGSIVTTILLWVAVVVAFGEGVPFLIVNLNPISPWATTAANSVKRKSS